MGNYTSIQGKVMELCSKKKKKCRKDKWLFVETKLSFGGFPGGASG